MTKHVFIAAPSYDGRVEDAWANSIVMEVPGLREDGWKITRHIRLGDADLAGSRNALMSEFMAGDFSDILFIDTDVIGQPGSIRRLLSHDADVVLGCPPYRTDDEPGFPVQWLKERAPERDGIIQIAAGPASFLRIRRGAIEAMEKEYPSLWYVDKTVKSGKSLAFFDFTIECNVRFSEDLTFFKRWRAIGGEVWLDPSLAFSHMGRKTYNGCIGEWIKQMAAAA